MSLVIHGLLLVVIAAQINVGAAKKHQKFAKEIKQQQAITAKLVITPPAPIVVKPPEPPKEKVEQKIEKKLVLPEISAKPTPHQKEVKQQEPRPKQKQKVVTEKKPAVEQKIKEKPEQKIEQKAPPAKPVKQPEPIANRAALVVEEPAAKSSTSSLSVLERSRAFIRQQTSAAPQYEIEGQNAGMSEMNNSFPVHDYQFIEEKTIDEKSEIKITCDTALKKASVIVSAGLLGGTLRCKPGHDLSKFIKAKEKPKFQYKLPEKDEDKQAND